MIKKSQPAITTKPVKENVVDGVLQNYLDQLLVTATQPQRVEKILRIEEAVAPTTASEPGVELRDAAVEMVSVEAESVTSVDVITVERLDDSVLPKTQVDTDERTSIADVAVETTELTSEINIKREHQLLTDQESWSSQGVECLVFSVCGLKLAVPLLFLGGVHEIKADDINPLIGQQSWYLGIVHTSESNLQVIDTAKFIMPERSRTLASEGFKYLIQLEKTPWAIACQSIDDTVRLEASEIKWRGERGKRTWLAGTVIEKMCALVDVSGLLQTVELNCRQV